MATPYPRALADHPRLRQSTLARFADCQLSAGFELQLSLGHLTDSEGLHRSGYTSHRAGAGRIAHMTVARALTVMLERKQERMPPDVVIELLDDTIRQATLPLAETFALPAHEDAQLRKTMRKWARDNEFTIADLAGVEERMEAVVAYPGADGLPFERILTGQLDALLLDPTSRHATVIDWKDTWKLPAARGAAEEDEEGGDDEDDRLSVEGYFQQRLYALLVFLTLPSVESVTLREFYLRRSKPREATIWRWQLGDLMAYFGALAERFDRCYESAITTRRGRRRRRVMATVAHWGEPSPGAHCSYCPKALDCPLDRDAREAGAVTTAAEAERAAGMLLVVRRAEKQLERSLRTWAEHAGPVRVRDAKRERYFGYVEAERVERPTRRQVEEAMLGGRDPRELFKHRTHTRFVDYSPDADVSAGLHDEDVVEMFERAAELARERNAKRRRRAAA